MGTIPSETVKQIFEVWCRYALMSEVSATPKPGLVDRRDNGAHTDMCFDTFAVSTEAIVPFLVQMAETGFCWEDPCTGGLFARIRRIGVRAEAAMFAATGGINTHKGMIFSMGIVTAAAGLYLRTHGRFCAEEILLLCRTMCYDTLEADFRNIDCAHPKTHGEILFAKYGSRGIRGEVQDGFPSIRNVSLPALRAARSRGLSDNEAYLDTLLALMSAVDDTNVLIRTSPAMLEYEKRAAARILAMGGASTEAGMDALRALNEDFIKKNLSPGGCADLLAVTILLEKLESLAPA